MHDYPVLPCPWCGKGVNIITIALRQTFDDHDRCPYCDKPVIVTAPYNGSIYLERIEVTHG